MFIWDFVANPVMESILDWFYSQMVGFLGAFFAQMGNMGVELFDLSWVRSVVRFFSQLGWALFAVSVVVSAFECGIEYASAGAISSSPPSTPSRASSLSACSPPCPSGCTPSPSPSRYLCHGNHRGGKEYRRAGLRDSGGYGGRRPAGRGRPGQMGPGH